MKALRCAWLLLAVVLAACEMVETDSPIDEAAVEENLVQSGDAEEIGGEAGILACTPTGRRTPFLRADCSVLDNSEPPHVAFACCSGRGIWECPGDGEAASELCVN